MAYELPIRLTHEGKAHIIPREQIPTTCTNQRSKACDCLGISEQNKIMDQLAKMLASQLHYKKRRM